MFLLTKSSVLPEVFALKWLQAAPKPSPRVQSRSLNSIVGFVETWPSLGILRWGKPNPFRMTESGMQAERSWCPVMIKPCVILEMPDPQGCLAESCAEWAWFAFSLPALSPPGCRDEWLCLLLAALASQGVGLRQVLVGGFSLGVPSSVACPLDRASLFCDI